MRKFFNFLLCIVLSPLLVAQQAAAPAAGAAAPARIDLDLSRVGPVRILSPDMASLAKIQRGRTIQFELSADAIYGNETLIPAGVPVNGVVTEIKHAVRVRQQDGQILIKVSAMVSGNKADIFVRCSNPADAYDKVDFAERANKFAFIGGIAAVAVALIVLATYHEK
jgi:hypothetical protein